MFFYEGSAYRKLQREQIELRLCWGQEYEVILPYFIDEIHDDHEVRRDDSGSKPCGKRMHACRCMTK